MDPAIPTARRDARPLVFVLCVVALFAGTVKWLAGPWWPDFLYRLLLEGILASVWLLGAAGYGIVILKLLKIRTSSRALIFSTAAGIGLGVISIATLLLGLLGVLNHATAIAILVIGWIGALANLPKPSLHKWQPASWLWIVIVPLLAIALVGAFELPGLLWNVEPLKYDALEYHLQVPREWFELGRIVPLEHNVFSYFPFNVEMHYLLAMHLHGGPWKGAYLAQLMHAVFIGLTVVAVFGSIRDRATPRGALIGAVLTAAAPWLLMLAPVAYNEGGLLLFTTLAVAWTIRAVNSGNLREIALAGAFAGLACGVKLTAVPMVLLAVPLAMSPLVHRVWKLCSIFILAGVVTFSPWLIRNAVWTGNPVFPEAMGLFGHGHFTDDQAQRWTAAHAPPPAERNLPARLVATGREIFGNFRYGFVLLPLALIAAIRAWRKPITRLLAIVIAIQFLIWIAATHLQGRFFVTAIPIAAMLIAQVETGQWLWICGCAAVVSAAVGVRFPGTILGQTPSVLGVDDFQLVMRESGMFSPQITQRLLDPDRPVVLVGDAKAFLYPIPMTRLHYRTVFDIKESWIDTIGLPPNAIVLVDPEEIKRFMLTYVALPDPPGDVAQHDEPYIRETGVSPVR